MKLKKIFSWHKDGESIRVYKKLTPLEEINLELDSINKEINVILRGINNGSTRSL